MTQDDEAQLKHAEAVSEEFHRLTGYSPEESIGDVDRVGTRNCRMLRKLSHV